MLPLIFLYYNNKIKSMKINYKKITLLLGLVTIVFSTFYFSNLNLENKKNAGLNQNNQNILSNEWVSYNNDIYNFSLDYPSGLDIKEEKNILGESQNTLGYSIDFRDPDDGYSFMRLNIFEKTDYSSLNDWLGSENRNLSDRYKGDVLGVKQVVEKDIKIDGFDAIVTFSHSNDEADEISKHERKTVFIKDGNLYVLSTRFINDSDHEKVWNSFHFLN
jgi:hypothetical protein